MITADDYANLQRIWFALLHFRMRHPRARRLPDSIANHIDMLDRAVFGAFSYLKVHPVHPRPAEASATLQACRRWIVNATRERAFLDADPVGISHVTFWLVMTSLTISLLNADSAPEIDPTSPDRFASLDPLRGRPWRPSKLLRIDRALRRLATGGSLPDPLHRESRELAAAVIRTLATAPRNSAVCPTRHDRDELRRLHGRIFRELHTLSFLTAHPFAIARAFYILSLAEFILESEHCSPPNETPQGQSPRTLIT